MAPLVEIPVLVIDELGKGRGSEWELSVLDELISKRYNAQRTTVFTSNFAPEDPSGDSSQPGSVSEEKVVDRVGVRIYSRLMEMCEPVRLQGPDYRRKLATERR
jgi:DNA replication protein DnaC